MQRFRHWTPRYFYDRLKLFTYEKKHPDYPWLTHQAIEILQSCLKKTDVGLEWGSGRSTLWFSKRIAHLTSVEDNPVWAAKVKKDCASANITNAELHYFDIPPNKDVTTSMYVKVVDNIPVNSLDFALVDGSFRCECALKVLDKIKPGGLLIIDNINWYLPCNSKAPSSRTKLTGPSSKQWQALSELLKDYRCVWTSNGITDTAIWIKP